MTPVSEPARLVGTGGDTISAYESTHSGVGTSKYRTFLRADDIIRLDQEVVRRKAMGKDVGPDGKKINVNRSTIIRDLIETHLPPQR